MTTQNSVNESKYARYHRLLGSLADAAIRLRAMVGSHIPEDPLNHEIDMIVSSLKSDKFRVGLFGVTGAGKSTFINALLGANLMKAGLGETSRVITEIHECDEDHPDRTVLVNYKTLEEINHDVNHLLPGYGVKAELNMEIAADLETLRSLVTGMSELNDDGSVKFLKAVVQGWPRWSLNLGKNENIEDFNDIDKNLHDRKRGSENIEEGEALAVFVKSRKIYSACPFISEGVVLLDTPGFGSGIQRHTEIAQKIAREVDAALILTKATYQFMEPDRKFIKKLFTYKKDEAEVTLSAGFVEYPLEIIFVLNQISDIPGFTDKENIDEQIDRLRSNLCSYGLTDVHIYPVDSACAFWAGIAKTKGSGMSESERNSYERYSMVDKRSDIPDPDRNYKISGFDKIAESDLPAYLTRVKYSSIARSHYFRLEIAAETFKKSIHRQIGLIKVNKEEQEKRREQFREDLEKCRGDLKILMEENLPLMISKMVNEYWEKNRQKKMEDLSKDFEVNFKLAENENKRIHDALTDSVSKQQKDSGKETKSTSKIAAETLKICIEQHTLDEIRSELSNEYRKLRNGEISCRVQNIFDRYEDIRDKADLMGRMKLNENLDIKINLNFENSFWESFWDKVGDCLPWFDSSYNRTLRRIPEKYKAVICPEIEKWMDHLAQHDFPQEFNREFGKTFEEMVTRTKREFQMANSMVNEFDGKKQAAEASLEKYSSDINNLFGELLELRKVVEAFRVEKQNDGSEN